MKLSDKAFADIIHRALERMPEEIRGCLDNVAITVEKRPSRELLEEMGLPPGEVLFGVYQGESLPEQSLTYPPLYPDSIILFREPLEDACETIEELIEEIEITVVHEVAHFFGISEEQLIELGYE